MFACQGFEIVPVIAGQVRSSARAVPRATVGSLVLSVSLYVGLAWACVVALPALASSTAPLADAAGVLGGVGLARLVAAGTSLSAVAIAFDNDPAILGAVTAIIFMQIVISPVVGSWMGKTWGSDGDDADGDESTSATAGDGAAAKAPSQPAVADSSA